MAAAQVAARVLAEEAARRRGKSGRPGSGRITWAMLERLDMAGRHAEARLLIPLVTVEIRKTRAKPKPDPEHDAAWLRMVERNDARRERERAAERVAEAQREAVARAARATRGAASVMLRFSLPALKAAAFKAMAGGAGLEVGDVMRAAAAALARLEPAHALRELARLAELPAAVAAGYPKMNAG